jgi:hypothetical protein
MNLGLETLLTLWIAKMEGSLHHGAILTKPRNTPLNPQKYLLFYNSFINLEEGFGIKTSCNGHFGL